MKSPRDRTRSFRVLAELLWLAVPAQAAVWLLAWHRLPERLATHFDLENLPNGWMSRPEWLIFSLAFTALLSATATWTLRRVHKPDAAAWGLLALFYAISGTLVWVGDAVIEFNAYHHPINVMPAVAAGVISAALLAVVALITNRGAQLSLPTILADEVHQSPAVALLLAAPSIALAALAASVPVPALRLTIGLVTAMTLAGAALAWSGFRYFFSPTGVEIRSLGFRLRSIPAREIKTYAIERWNRLDGYGIRGVGNRRAYVWGNRGVRIQTIEGEVFLGHSQPEKLMRDLDLVVRDRALHDKF
jgi:hypothetical protein